jgi:T5SS/PEP-CTERM-associated repeat protein/autotransporter-associated beta strand protein
LGVAGGGTVAASNIIIASGVGSSGTLNIGRFGTNDTGGTIITPTIAFGDGTGVINLNQSDAVTITSAISGAGTINQLGAGTTTLSGANTYSGTTLITNGTLQTATASALGTSAVQLEAGSLAPVGTLNIGSLAWNGGTIASTLGTNTSFIGLGTNFTLGANGGRFAFTGDGGFAANTAYSILGWTNISSFALTNFSGNTLLGLAPIFTINGTNLVVNFEGATSGSILQNSSDVYTPVYANFQVSNNVTTGTLSESNTVAALTFADGSTLTVNNTLNVTNGNLTVSNGLATVTNGTLATPGDFNKLGAGTLALLGAAQVGSNAVIDAGALLVEGNVNAVSDLYIGRTNSNIAMVISNGGTVRSGSFNNASFIGYASSSSNNSVLVTGTDSVWTNGFDLYVGFFGSGNSLIISDGGTVANSFGYVGLSSSSSRNSVLVSGTNSLWTNSNTLYVGLGGSGNSVVISNGGTVANTEGSIGRVSNSTGNNVLVTGPGSLWTNSGSLFVGNEGSANRLVISNGGVVANADGYIGFRANSSNNSVLVTGTNSLWTNSGTLIVGNAGSGHGLGVAGGGTVAASNIIIASGVGSSGTLNIGRFGTNDTGGTIITPTIAFGDGTGVINLNQSDAVTITSAISGAGTINQLGAGTTTLSGANTYSGTTLITNGTLQTATASALGTSAVQLEAGSLAPVGTLNIGSLAWNGGTIASTLGTNTSFIGLGTNFTLGANGGRFAFTGDGGFAANTAYSILGWTNISSFALTNFSGNTLLGLAPIFTINGTNLVVNFEGATSGSILQNSSNVYTPVYANFQVSNNVTTGKTNESNTVAALTFADGSTLTVYNTLNVTNGSFTVNSGLATVTNGTLATPGAFNKLGAGTLALLGAAQIGSNAVIDAGALVVEGNVNAGGEFYVGQTNSSIAMVVSNGGTVANAEGFIGFTTNSSNNTALVTGTNSVWTNSGALYIGEQGSDNLLTISDGGTVANADGYIGFASSAASNSVLVTGTGSVWTNSSQIFVGVAGSGNRLVISNAGRVATSAGFIGAGPGSSDNSVLVTGTSSTLTSSGRLDVGSGGSGNSMTIVAAGLVAATDGYIGATIGSSNNTVLISGAESLWTNSGEFVVGLRGTGNTLTLADGGTVAASNIIVASAAGSSGTLNIGRFGTNDTGGTIITPTIAFGDGTGAINFNQRDATTITGVISGTGSIRQIGAGTTTLSGANTYSGTTTISAGVLQVGDGGSSGSLGSSAVVNNASLIFNRAGSLAVGGVISGSGSIRQIGAGTTTLSGANTYSGTTLITNGTLQTANASALGVSAVQLGAGSLAPVGTLNIGSLAWNGGTIASTLGTNTSFIGIVTDFTLGAGSGTFAFTADGGFAANTAYSILGWTNMGSLALTNFSGNALLGLDPIFTINGTNLLVNFEGSSSGEIIQNNSPTYTPDYANFFVSNNATTMDTNQSNIVNSLIFAPASSLQVYNQLQVTSGNFTVGTGNATVHGGELFVPGDFTKLGDGLLDLLGKVLVNGRATVNAGGLLINGDFTANSLTVLRNALLGGAGTIFGNVFNNGTVSPGNSPGTLNIVGNYTQGSSGNFDMEIAGRNNFDRLVASGTASLAGTLTVTTVDGGTLAFGDKYQFLSAGGGISGEFDTIAMPSGFRGRFLADSSNTQGTLLVAPLSYTQVAVTPNQRRVAKALDAFIPAKGGDRETVSIALDELTAEQYPSAFESIMPSLYASLPTMAFNVANALNTSMFQRMWMQRISGRAMSISGMAPQPLRDGKQFAIKSTVDEVPMEEAADNNWGVFVDGNGVFANANSGGLLQNYKSQSGGVTAGASYKWGENLATGVYVGYQGLQAQYDGGSRVTDNAVRFGGFGAFGLGGFYANGLVGGAWHTYDMDRSIEFGTIDRTARGNTGAGELDVALSTGYDIKAGNFTFGPVTSLQYTYLNVQGFQETGADSLDLDVQGYNSSSLLYSLGAQAAYRWQVTKKFAVTPMISASWQHEFLQNAYTINSSFNNGGPSSPFGFQTSQPQQDYFYAGAGVGLNFGDTWEASFFWNAAAANADQTSQNIYFSIGAKF